MLVLFVLILEIARDTNRNVEDENEIIKHTLHFVTQFWHFMIVVIVNERWELLAVVVVVIAVATIAINGRPTQGQGREEEITKRTEQTWNRAVCNFFKRRGGRRESSGDWKGSMRDRVLNTDINSYQLRTDDRREGQGGKKWPDTLTLGTT